jgi:protein subunit release factor A
MYPPKPKVTITHVPSGISAYCDQCRTDRENHDKAMNLLRSRLWASQQVDVMESDLRVETFSPKQEGKGDE